MEQQTIDVDFVGGEPTYSTLEEATAAAARKARRVDSERVRGKTVVDYQYVGDSLFLSLSGGLVLQVWAAMAGVQWQIVEQHLTEDVLIPEELTLRFPDGSVFPWRWKAMLDSFRGRKVRYVGPAGETMAVLYVEGCPDTLLSVLKRRTSTEKFLFFAAE